MYINLALNSIFLFTYNLYIGETSKNCEAISLINVYNSNILISLSNLKRRDREGNFSLYSRKNGM